MNPELLKRLLLILLMAIAQPAAGQIYKWVDSKGMVHYSDDPPKGANPVPVNVGPQGATTGDPKECHTIKCQGERLEAAKAREAEAKARQKAKTPPAAPPPRGLAFDKFIRLQKGMSEGEVLVQAGPPDQAVEEGKSFSSVVLPSGISTKPGFHVVKSYYYFPTDADPFTTRIVLTGGIVTDLQRTRKF